MMRCCDTAARERLGSRCRMRLFRAFVIAFLTALALGAVSAGPVSAASCAQEVINDWYKHGSVTGHYPAHCYTEAIAALPEDSKQYSSAPEDIRRDMLLAIRGDSSGGTNGPGSGGIVPTGFGPPPSTGLAASGGTSNRDTEIGRASCRERGESEAAG